MTLRARFLVATAIAAQLTACGARTGLQDHPFRELEDASASEPVVDAARDVPKDTPSEDVVDATFEAPPPICVDAGITFIYLVTAQDVLFSYYPPNGALTEIGKISCPAAPGETPFSMSVDRGGTAYVVFTDGSLFLVDTANAACVPTTFQVGQQGFVTFGMGFTANASDPGETLYVAESNQPSLGLGSIDTKTYDLSFVGPFSDPIGRTELTGTGDGRLYGFSIDTPGPGGHLSQIDPATAKILSSTALAVGDQQSAFAFAFWGDDFYLFTTQGGASQSTITRYRPADGTLVKLATTPGQTIVGAGVSTCAPH